MLSIAERHRYILDNLNKYRFVRITDVANQLGMSLRHLNRLCNASCGCSIHHLILQERMERARFLLESTSLSLTDISEMIGYSSVYAFIRAFKSNTGISPGKYQKDAGRR